MQLTELEQIVGPINRRFLDEGFPSEATVSAYADTRYLSDDKHKVKPPPLIEDLSYLNPSRTLTGQISGRKKKRKVKR